MASRRRRDRGTVHGWLVLDKSSGVTSAGAAHGVRKALGAAKAGHGGTLDPLATGVLPIALGEATKTMPYLVDGEKTYEFTVRWGASTTTDDAEGEVLDRHPGRPDAAAIAAALPAFRGEIEQVPPAYSAVKIGGKRAYALARENKQVDLTPRQVRIDRFELVDMPDADHARFTVDCGKGTYMRGLARDLGLVLGTLGHVVALRRTRVGPFHEKQAISLENLQGIGHSAAVSHLLPVETVLDDIPELAITESEARLLKSGQPVPLLSMSDRDRIGDLQPGETVTAMASCKLVALGRFDEGCVHPVRVFHL